MAKTQVAKQIEYLNPGNLDGSRGPYATVAEACLAIPNNIVGGRNLREGKIVDIGIEPNTTEWRWVGGFADTNLVKNQPDVNTYPFIGNKLNNDNLLKLVKDVLITSAAINVPDKKTIWIENTTPTSTKIVFYSYTSQNVQTNVATATVNFDGVVENVKTFPLISSLDGVTTIGYISIDKTYLAPLAGVTLSKPQHELSKDIFNVKNGRYISFNFLSETQASTSQQIPPIKNRLDVLEPKIPILTDKMNILVNGFKTDYSKVNDAIKKITIYNRANLTDFRLHRFFKTADTLLLNIRANSGANVVEFNYDSRIAGAVYPVDIRNHFLTLKNNEGTVFINVLIDWIAAEGIPLAFPNTPTYNESGISIKYIINGNEAEAIKNGLGTGSGGGTGGGTVSGGSSTVVSPTNVTVVGAGSYAWLVEYLNNTHPEGTFIVSSVESEINTFLDTFLSSTDRHTVRFFGQITTALGLRKHPNLNFDGYNCTLKMGDNLDQNYQMCIRPTNGGIPPTTSRVIDHKYSYIKGFTLDGNQSKNATANTFYASGICSEIFHIFVEPYTGTQYTTNIIVEDINTLQFIRNGIVSGKGWRLRNIDIEYSRIDHGLYIPGGGDVFGENITFRGFFGGGPLSIAGNNKSYQLFKTDNVHLKNVVMNECTGGVWVDIRGQFPNTLYPCSNILIDGLTIISTEKRGNLMFTLGSELGPDVTTPTSDNYPKNIEIRNLNADININNDVFRLSKGQFKISGRIKANLNRDRRAMFFVKGAGDNILNSIDISGLDFEFTGTPVAEIPGEPGAGQFPLFHFDNETAPVLALNGLNMNGTTIKGNSLFCLFAVRNINASGIFTVKNLNMKNIIGSPISVIKTGHDTKISFIKDKVLSELPGSL